ncbi:MAG TPA: cupredoxin family copper-binding protein [Casimicrobiaceae bacterium]|jgi:plastocyanin
MMMVQSWRFAAAALALSLCINMDAAAADAAPKSTNHTIVIDSVRFEPQALTVKIGDTVTWVNKDPFPHTATSQAGGFDSREIAPGQSWRYTAIKLGIFPYVCALHPTMKGTLTVQ